MTAEPDYTLLMAKGIAARHPNADVVSVEEHLARRVIKLSEALDASVKLQAHYATLLNAYDGGERQVFASAQALIDRLDALAAEASKS